LKELPKGGEAGYDREREREKREGEMISHPGIKFFFSLKEGIGQRAKAK